MKKSYGKTTDKNLRLWIEFSRLNQRIVREIFKDFQDYDLSPSQFAVIEALYHKGDLSVGDVTKAILMTSGNLTVVAKNLEKRGLITTRLGDDRRRKILSITEEGRRKLEAVFPLHLDRLNHFLNNYTDEEKDHLITLLSKGRKDLPKE